MDADIGWIVRLEIIHHFKKERYYLVYRKTDTDYILLNITSRDKVNGIDPRYQHELSIRIESEIISIINLNTLVVIEHKLFSDLFIESVEQWEPKVSEEEIKEIRTKLEKCFTNKSFRSNLYRCRVLPENDKKTLEIILTS